MTVLRLEAVEFQDPAAGGPGPDPASVCLAMARAETAAVFPIGHTTPGWYSFSVFVRARHKSTSVTLVLADSEGEDHATFPLSRDWVRHVVSRRSGVGGISVRLHLGEPGEEVPIRSDCLFAYPQVEASAFATSPIGPRPPRQLWAFYARAGEAIAARSVADEMLGAPVARDGRLMITSGVVLQHPTTQVVAVPATSLLYEAVTVRGVAPHPASVGTLGADWAGAIPLPLTHAAMRDAADAFAVPALVGPDGSPISETSPTVMQMDADIRQLVRALSTRTQDLRALDPRVFEMLVAHLLERDGYEVKLQPRSGRAHPDHGIDVLAIRKAGLGSFVVGVQCKRFKNGNAVSGEMVRSLMGALKWNNLDRGVLVTTSEFQPQAFEYEAGAPHRVGLELDLVEYHRLMRWLRLYG